jgi:2-octaprenyl-6-methoxyphenol hydroxylase
MSVATEYDVLIIGGGLVGGTLACALNGQNLRIGLIEAYPFKSAHQPSYDDRSIALAYGSRRILEGIGLWPKLAEQATAIKKIHISDRGHFGFTHLDCRDSGHEALGYVIENRAIGNVFAEALATQNNIDVLCPAQLDDLQIDGQHARVTIQQTDPHGKIQSRQLRTRLVIGADGGQSAVRRLSNIDSRHWDYGQSAIIANISPELPHLNRAYERFTDSGPLALLPMSEQRCSLVWTVRNRDVDSMLALDDEAFLSHLQQRFGDRLGQLQKSGRRSSYPLHLIRARPHETARVTLIGNAAHTLHPIAGQGFNLGIRDVAALAEVLSTALEQGQDIGAPSVLQQYEHWRRHDQRHVAALTDTLVRVFSNNFTPLVLARNTGLLAMDLFSPLKRHLTRQAMGLNGHLPRLARGLPL